MVDAGPCRLCLTPGCTPAGKNKHRDFVHCPSCGLVFVPQVQWLTVDDERARYTHHDNSETNPGYVRFLGEVASVVGELAGPGARVLDFGAGENAILAGQLRRMGYDAVAYDPLYGLGKDALSGQYDVVILCEVIEHLRELREELLSVRECLGAGGFMVVRTQCYPSVEEVSTWWYARDATHINFFSPRTLAFAADLCGLVCQPTARPDITLWRTR
jgi:2-polyprenyl-3-methyl-5-hydroxy-6-metoxy-1,4-benzoquinol methylase